MLRTEPSDKDYYFHNIGLKKTTANVWKAVDITVRGKAAECKG
ncbi:hypothetical protein NKH77_23305 [Streptomyces sp. M19]